MRASAITKPVGDADGIPDFSAEKTEASPAPEVEAASPPAKTETVNRPSVRLPPRPVPRGTVAGRPVQKFNPSSISAPPAKAEKFEAIGPEDADGAKKTVSAKASLVTRPLVVPNNTKPGGRVSNFAKEKVIESPTHVFFYQTNPIIADDGVSPMLLPASDFQMLITDGDFKTLHEEDFSDEAAAYKSLLDVLNNRPRAQLVSFEGRMFILPRINVVALKHGLTLGLVARTNDRYASYSTRFSQQYHHDVADVISNFGAVKAPSLLELHAAILGNEDKKPVEKLKDIFQMMKSA